jgi:hypothetical protein
MAEGRTGWGKLRQSLGRSQQARKICATLAGLAVCALALSRPPLSAKEKRPTTKTLTGQVLDQAENGIDGASVTLKDLQTGVTTAVYTRDGGHYQFYDLKPNHDYEIQATSKGGKSETRQVNSVDTRMRIVINLTIPPPSS